MTDTVCLTGATGFVGRHLTAALLARGLTVSSISRKDVPRIDGRVEVQRGSLLDHGDSLRFLRPGSALIHLAYSATPDPTVNLAVARNLVMAAGMAGVKKMVHVSTAAVVGRVDADMVDEATPCNPSDDYERIKLEIEHILASGCRQSGIPLVIVRPTAIFGQGGENLVKLIQQVDHDRPTLRLLRACLYGRRRLNLVAIDNVVAAICHVLNLNTPNGECFFISDDHVPENNYVDVAETVRLVRGISSPAIRSAVDLSPFLPATLRALGRSNVNPRRVYRCEKLLASGYRPAVPFLDAVKAFAARQGRASDAGTDEALRSP